ncbi:dehydrogenase/reductase SDR family member 11-like [Schistocerca piceifrons]|uniref:dehydrogenase/reductase SDR family member 11-like n=1 Tax=Schistocerca piceifrons TaxID=274613 RepID=UPI001F5FEF13|nr:dehydrogenase/reductase SDR family member 11-like [Schistocerca piceifrons]
MRLCRPKSNRGQQSSAMGIERYAGRVAMVTGASSGIGAAITQALLRKGLTVVGLARRVDRVKALALKDAPGKLHAIQCDVSNEESILAAFKWVKGNLKGVDILINNAGVGNDADLITGKTEDWKRILDVNVLGLSICTREAVQDMMTKGIDDGVIIHISSDLGHMSPPAGNIAMYIASKHMVKTLLDGLRKDLAKKKSKIRVGEISPGPVKTEFASNFKQFNPEMLKLIPLHESEDVAEIVICMLSQDPRLQVHDVIMHPTGSAH